MNKVTMKTYAVEHKLSLFNVMKMVKNNTLNSIVEEKNGKEITYILIDEATEKKVKEGTVSKREDKNISLQEQVKYLMQEVQKLKEEIAALKKR